MTTLVLVQRKILSAALPARFGQLKIWFEEINRDGIIMTALAWIIAVLITLYLGSLYMTFKTGFIIQEVTNRIAKVDEDILSLELRLQERRSRLAYDNTTVLESMERISDIKYLTTGTLAASLKDTLKP